MDKNALERIYSKYNRFCYIHPDPLEFVYRYEDPLDRELAGFIASTLAYGRVRQILKSVSVILDRMGPSPRRYLGCAGGSGIEKTFSDFKHRFTTAAELSAMLCGLKRVLRRHGSLEACFAGGMAKSDRTVIPALRAFLSEIIESSGGRPMSLVPSPDKESACKRMHLYLRWMVRKDEVDPGVWRRMSPAMLVVPLDTHMHRICRALDLTRRKGASLRTALEITEAFSYIVPEDPVRYDFSLTRAPIRGEKDPVDVLRQKISPEAA